MPASVRLENLVRQYGTVTAVGGVTLEIKEGEFFALLGPSGCGKTTTMRCIAGFDVPSSGEIYIGDTAMGGLPSYLRPCGMVFQSYALFPHMSVYENLAYGFHTRRYREGGLFGKLSVLGHILSSRIGKLSATEHQRVLQALRQVDLDGLAERMPSQLSGGQQQRVALARALVVEPKVLLLDEPLSNLDKKLRGTMRTLIRRIQRQMGITTIFVTHDQEEALSMADRIAVMDAGRVTQVGTPHNIYESPRSAFVADFIGTANCLPVRVEGEMVVAGDFVLKAAGQPSGSQAVIRPESLRILARGEEPAAGDNVLNGTVLDVVYLGNWIRYEVAVGNHKLLIDQSAGGSLAHEGSEVRITVAPERVLVI